MLEIAGEAFMRMDTRKYGVVLIIVIVKLLQHITVIISRIVTHTRKLISYISL